MYKNVHYHTVTLKKNKIPSVLSSKQERGFGTGQEQGYQEKYSKWIHMFSNSINKLGPGNCPVGTDCASFQKYSLEDNFKHSIYVDDNPLR